MQFYTSREEIIEYVRTIDPVQYGRRRNYIGESTQISPYITRGLITLTEVRDILRNSYTDSQLYPLVFELAWREYWQREWHYRGDVIFSDIKRRQEGATTGDIPVAVLDTSTGIQAIDTAVTSLQTTGYIHNHERLWLAGLICNTADTHWWEPSRWMHYYLLDGDPASNCLSWQWVAGTFSSKKYLTAQSNINQYSPLKQAGTIIDHDYETLMDMPVPELFTERAAPPLAWQRPDVPEAHLDPTTPVNLYHTFWLNSEWRKDDNAQRILLLEPKWFEKFPVAPLVTDYILKCAAEIPGLQVIVANFEDVNWPQDVVYMDHPSVKHWRGSADTIPLLFPDVPDKSFNSFMSFWKQCQKTSK